MTTYKTIEISAKTCTFKTHNQEGNGALLRHNLHYTIPVFHNPYSWTDEQISMFIYDIFYSFWGNDGMVSEEPLFIGSMHFSAKNDKGVHEIIDGQQRLTTFLILLKVLKVKYPFCKELELMDLNWLSTKVNDGKQQLYLEEVISDNDLMNNETLNPLLKNAFFIKEFIEEQLIDKDGHSFIFNIDQFVIHLLSNICFVVIETRAGLSRTLQIFKSINSNGLDLYGEDVFKIRMYAYLKDKQGCDEKAFYEISELFQKVDEFNQNLKYNFIDFDEIQRIYQVILIAKYNLPLILNGLGTDAFFERLFDTILNIGQWEHFNNPNQEIELSILEINKIIDVRFKWENNWYKTADDQRSYKMIENSKYSKFANYLPVLLMYKDKSQDVFEIINLLAKVYFSNSVRFQKSFSEMSQWTYSLIGKIINGDSKDQLILFITEKLGAEESNDNSMVI